MAGDSPQHGKSPARREKSHARPSIDNASAQKKKKQKEKVTPLSGATRSDGLQVTGFARLSAKETAARASGVHKPRTPLFY